MKGRTTWYVSVEEMQTDLDAYLDSTTRSGPTAARGRGMEGHTPYAAFKAGLKKARAAAKQTGKEEQQAA